MSVGDMYPKIRTSNSNSNLQEIDTSASPTHSPQPNYSPNSRNSSPGRYHEWHRTSFKVGKTKPSKTRYMKKSEVIGVILSAILSLLFALSFVALMYFGTPLVIDRISTIFDLDFSTENHAHGTKITVAKQSVKRSIRLQEQKAIKVVENLTGSTLRTKYINKQQPVVFTYHSPASATTTNDDPSVNTTSTSPTCHQEEILLSLLASIGDEDVSLLSMKQFYQRNEHPISPSSASSGSGSSANPSYTLSSYLSLDSSFNMDLLEDDKSYFVSSSTLSNHVNFTMDTSSTITDTAIKTSFNGEVVISIGKDHPQLSSTPFHVHKATINYLVKGRKHWIAFRVDQIPNGGFNPLQSVHTWLQGSNDTTLYHDHVIHIFQESGQYVYLPEGYYHASETLSTEGSVSISYRSQQTTSNSFYQYYVEGKDRLHKGDYSGSIRMLKLGLGINRNVLLLQELANAYIHMESYTLAEEVLREIIQLNPRHSIAYSELINLMINHANRDISENISELLEQANDFGIREDVLSLSHDNL